MTIYIIVSLVESRPSLFTNRRARGVVLRGIVRARRSESGWYLRGWAIDVRKAAGSCRGVLRRVID